MRPLDTLAVIVSILGLGGALQDFFIIPLLWKLFGIAAGALVVVWFAAQKLGKWAKPGQSASFAPPPRARSKTRTAVSALALGVLCTILVFISGVVVRHNGVTVEVDVSADNGVEFLIEGAIQSVTTLTIQLPQPTHKQCKLVDPIGGSRYRADVVMVDWNTANPQLELSNFVYPQLLSLRCLVAIEPDLIIVRVEPRSTEVFYPDRTYSYNRGIIVAGGFLWFAGLVLLWFRSA